MVKIKIQLILKYTVVYRAENSYEANFIKGLLSKRASCYSIKSKLLGDNLSIAIG